MVNAIIEKITASMLLLLFFGSFFSLMYIGIDFSSPLCYNFFIGLISHFILLKYHFFHGAANKFGLLPRNFLDKIR